MCDNNTGKIYTCGRFTENEKFSLKNFLLKYSLWRGLYEIYGSVEQLHYKVILGHKLLLSIWVILNQFPENRDHVYSFSILRHTNVVASADPV